MDTTDSSLDWDWDSFKVDAPPPTLLDPYGELQPMEVDESLTSLLFRPTRPAVIEQAPSAPVEPPASERIVRPSVAVVSSADLQGELFETV